MDILYHNENYENTLPTDNNISNNNNNSMGKKKVKKNDAEKKRQRDERERERERERQRENEIRAFRNFSSALPSTMTERTRSRGSMNHAQLQEMGYINADFGNPSQLEALNHAPQPDMNVILRSNPFPGEHGKTLLPNKFRL